jgi:hypothetical protein
MFATAMLAVVSDIAMDLVENISGALFVSDLFTNLLGSAALSGNTAGIMQASMQQLGLGLILSTLLISTPPMAAQFFNGVMGQFNHMGAFGGGGMPVAGMAPMGGYVGAGGYGAAGAAGARGANGAAAPSTAGSRNTEVAPQVNPVNTYIPQTNASVNQDVIKPSSDIGNASKGFASNELVQADRAVHRDVTQSSNKNIAIALVGVTILSSGGVIEETKAQSAEFWQQAQEQQRRQQEQAFQLQQIQWQQMHDPNYACVGGRDIYGYIGDAACGGGVNIGNTAPPPVIQKPSSYGAVAQDNKMGYVGTASKQASKQASINLAIQKCGTDNCEIIMEYANQCMAYAYGQPLKGFKSKSFIEVGLTKKAAEKSALSACRKGARDCKIFVSECSLP